MRKKKWGLTLGGGGASSLIALGVLQYIVDHDIKVSEITATSMGAIIAGMWTLGYSPRGIMHILSGVTWRKMIDPDLRTGLIKGKKIHKKLKHFLGEKTMDECSVPLTIVATDLNNGDMISIKEGSIVDAIRSSISIPGIFAPFKHHGRLLVDGGLTNNLPVDLLRNKNAIAVSACGYETFQLRTTSKLFGITIPRHIIGMEKDLIIRTRYIMFRGQEDMSIKAAKGDVRLIRPVLNDIKVFDIERVEEAFEIGYKEAKKVLNSIA